MMLFMIGVSVVWIGLYIGGARSHGLREKPVRARGWVPTASRNPRQLVGKCCY